MQKITLFSTVLIIALSILGGCTKSNNQIKYVHIDTDSLKGSLIADTIIYDVIIKNRDTDDYWTEHTLRYLKQREFVDSLFAVAYSEKAHVFDLFSEKRLSRKDIEEIESQDGFSRDNIGKLQFREVWFFDSQHVFMRKQVYSIVLGSEKYSESGEFRGYSPVFRLDLNTLE